MWRRKKIREKKFTEATFSNLVSYLLHTYQKKSTEKLGAKSILWAKLDMRISQRRALNCVVIYRQHNSPDQFQTYFGDTLEKGRKRNKPPFMFRGIST